MDGPVHEECVNGDFTLIDLIYILGIVALFAAVGMTTQAVGKL
ncbi:hypothetical protein ACHABX_07625 [Nesterenkonia halotolerans]